MFDGNGTDTLHQSRLGHLRSTRRMPLTTVVLVLALALVLGALPAALTGCRPSPSVPATGSGPGGGDATPPGDGDRDPATLASALEVHYIDVGQGDAILLLTDNGASVLIDGGPRPAGRTVLDYLAARGVEQLDVVIATHPHADHIGGLIDVLRTLPVSRIIDSGWPYTTKTFRDYMIEVERQVAAGHCTFETPEGQQFELAANVIITVLGPAGTPDSANNASVVVRLDYGATSFLFTGDAEVTAEAALPYNRLGADVLKVGRHASRSSTSRSFLKAVSPRYAVICVGADNEYGHPHQVIIDRLLAAGVAIYRTDYHGHIVFTSDGSAVTTALTPWSP